MEIILPKMLFCWRPDIDNSILYNPLFFLAGPILGGGNWQERACHEFMVWIPRSLVAVPCRWGPSHALSPCFLQNGLPDAFYRQAQWEYHYLALAVEKSQKHEGCIVFWLPEESKDNPRSDGQPYARDTYGEIGRWGKTAALANGHIVVGAEPDFPGLSVIAENLRLDFGLRADAKFPIHPSLEATITAAVDWVKQK